MIRWVIVLLRALLGGLFVYAGVVKAWGLADFSTDISGFQLLPAWAVTIVALYLPWLELLCGLALLTGRLVQGAVMLLMGLMVVFVLALASAWVRGLDVRCGCFGDIEQMDYAWLILRDVMILLGLVILRWQSYPHVRKSEYDNKRQGLKSKNKAANCTERPNRDN